MSYKMSTYGELLLLPTDLCSTVIDECSYRNHPWSLPNNQVLKYVEVINYSRRYCLDQDAHNCVMCGKHNVTIPSQNKDVCKACDSSCWFSSKLNVVFKFCKGCKNFFALEEFREKPEASKCGKCRKRGRENYISKKMESNYLINGEDYPIQRKGSIDCNIIADEYLSSNCPSVATIEEEECDKSSPTSACGLQFFETSSNNKRVDSTFRRPPKVPKRSSPCSETRHAMNDFGTPKGRDRGDSITQLIACGEQLDCSPQEEDSNANKRQRMLTTTEAFKLMYASATKIDMQSNDVNVVTPSAPHSTYRSKLVTDSPISSLHLAVTPPDNSMCSVGIRSASPRSILKGHNKENVLEESFSLNNVEEVNLSLDDVKTEFPSVTSRSRQVSFSGDNLSSPPSTMSSLQWDPSVDPLLNLAVLVSSATAEKV